MSSRHVCAVISLCSVFLSSCDSQPIEVLEVTAGSVDVPSGTVEVSVDPSGNVDSDSNTEEDNFGDAYWAELAQSYPAFVPPPEIGAAHDAADNINLGRWGEVIDWPQIATGAAQLPDGRLLTWSSTQESGFGGGNTYTHGSVFDPVTETFTDQPNEHHNMFCAGISMLADGSVFTAGGGKTITTTSMFANDSWSLTDSLNTARWYPQSTTLPSGQVLISLGTDKTALSEIWTPGEGWRSLPGANLQSVLDDTSATKKLRDWFPAMNVAPDGSLFHPGPTSELFSLDLYTNGGSITSHGQRETGDPHRLYNTTVMYDIGKMLIAGGGKPALNTALTIDVNGSVPVVTEVEPMTYARSMQDSIVLPNGQVLVIGGNSSGVQFSDEGTQLHPELWDPQTGQWQTLAPHSKPRNYHSTALLLKDGRVAAMGSGLCGNCATNQQNGEIFEPPYLFNADGTRAIQPQITNGPDEAVAGDTLNIVASNGLAKFSMVRLVALTHHHTTDQRFIPLSFTESIPGDYQVQLPANSFVLIPGYYWVFGLDGNGVPTEGHTLMINPTVDEVPEPPKPISYQYYEGEWNSLPDFDSLTPLASGKTSSFNLEDRLSNNHFGFRYNAAIELPESGTYTFYTSSDDGSQLFVDDTMVVDNDGLHGTVEEQGTVELSQGTHNLTVTYFEKTGGNSLAVQLEGPSISKQAVEPFLLPLSDTGNPPTNSILPNNGTFADNLTDWQTCGGEANATSGAAILSDGGCIYQEFAVTPQAQYTVTCDAAAPTGFASVQLAISDAGYASLVTELTEVTSTTMAPVSAAVSAPEAGAHGVITLYAAQQAAFDNCLIDVDDSAVSPVNPAPPATATNDLLVNADFSNNLDDWSSCGGQQTPGANGVDGDNAVNLTDGGCLFQQFDMTPGTLYDLVCVAHSAQDFTSVTLNMYDSTFNELDTQEAVVTNSISFTSSEISTVAPANARYAAITLYADTDATFDSCGIVASGGIGPAPLPVIDPADNLLLNADFTNSDDNWLSCGGTHNVTTNGADGSNAMNLGANGCIYQEFSAVAGKEYEARCVGSANGYASLSLGYSDVDYASLSSSETPTTSATLSTLSLTGSAPAETERGVITLYADESAVFDDCAVVER